MRKNRKFALFTVLFCATVLFFAPLLTAKKASPVTPASVTPATSEAAMKKTTKAVATTAQSRDAVAALKAEKFTVLHADGKTKSQISCRDFLVFTLAAEMLPSFEPEALKAQAVASYTYFCYERDREKETPQKALCGADFADTPVPFPDGYTAAYWKEKWGDKPYADAYKKLAAAVDAVAGVQLHYDGKPILAAYHAISSGKTETAEAVWASAMPYLQSVDSAADKNAPDYVTTVRFSATEFRKALADVKGISLSADPATWIANDAVRSAAGTVLKQTVGTVALTGKAWRERFGLRSACFSVAYKDGNFVFTVKGYGHGVGLSQYGAQFAALDGDDYQTILHRYYTGVTIE